MTKLTYFILLIFLLFSLSGCFELIEDTTLNEDGTGTYKLTINLSSSTVKVNSIMAMDSINGEKLPSRKELKTALTKHIKFLENRKGISNVKADLNTENWIFHLQLDFQSLDLLKKGVMALSKEIDKNKTNKNPLRIEMNYSASLFQRKLSPLVSSEWQDKIKEDKDYEQLKQGKCVFIHRFNKDISEVSSKEFRIAKNRKAAMLQLSPYEIINQPEKLDYFIKTKP